MLVPDGVSRAQGIDVDRVVVPVTSAKVSTRSGVMSRQAVVPGWCPRARRARDVGHDACAALSCFTFITARRLVDRFSDPVVWLWWRRGTRGASGVAQRAVSGGAALRDAR